MSAKKAAEQANAVAEQLPDWMADAYQYAGAGASDVASDYVMPFLAIAQKGSPQLNKKDPKYIEGLSVGDLFNTATHESWTGEGEGDDVGVHFVPAHYIVCQVEWKLRQDGGGYVATHPRNTPLLSKCRKDDMGRNILPSGTQLVETAYWFGIIVETGDKAVISMSSTALGASRNWQTLMTRFKLKTPTGEEKQAPAFMRKYRLTTVYQTNDKGDWYNWKITDAGENRIRSAYESAVEFYKIVTDPQFVMGRPAEAAAITDDRSPDNLPI